MKRFVQLTSALLLAAGMTVVTASLASAGAPSAPASPTSTPPPAGACSATYTVRQSGPGGYVAVFTVRNNGGSTLTWWSVAFGFPGSQQVRRSWNATVTQSGQLVVARSTNQNGRLAPGATTSFGLVISGENEPILVSCTGNP